MALSVLVWERRNLSQLGTVVFTLNPVTVPFIGYTRGVVDRRDTSKDVFLRISQDCFVPLNQGETNCACTGKSGASVKNRQQAKRSGNGFSIRALGAKSAFLYYKRKFPPPQWAKRPKQAGRLGLEMLYLFGSAVSCGNNLFIFGDNNARSAFCV